MNIPAFRRACLTYVESFGFDLPPAWCNAAGGAEVRSGHKAASKLDDAAAYIAAEDAHLAGLTRYFLGGARAPRTYGNLRNPGLKPIWFQAPRGRSLPPTGGEAAAYFTKAAEASGTAGGVAQAKSALSMTGSFNDLHTAVYTKNARQRGPRVDAPLAPTPNAEGGGPLGGHGRRHPHRVRLRAARPAACAPVGARDRRQRRARLQTAAAVRRPQAVPLG